MENSCQFRNKQLGSANKQEGGGREGSPACEFGRGQTIPRHNKRHATQHYKGHWTLKLNVFSLQWWCWIKTSELATSKLQSATRHRSAAAHLLGLWVRIPPGAWMSAVSVVCCQVEVSATGWSLVQRSPTDCGASLSVIYKPREWEGPGPLGAVAPKVKVTFSGSTSHSNGIRVPFN